VVVRKTTQNKISKTLSPSLSERNLLLNAFLFFWLSVSLNRYQIYQDL
jgi:hypothetical protein